MTPAEQLDVLHQRLAGLVLMGRCEPVVKLAEGSTEAERVRGEWLRGLLQRINQLHEDYAQFARAQIEATKKPADGNGRPVTQPPAAAGQPQPRK